MFTRWEKLKITEEGIYKREEMKNNFQTYIDQIFKSYILIVSIFLSLILIIIIHCNTAPSHPSRSSLQDISQGRLGDLRS